MAQEAPTVHVAPVEEVADAALEGVETVQAPSSAEVGTGAVAVAEGDALLSSGGSGSLVGPSADANHCQSGVKSIAPLASSGVLTDTSTIDAEKAGLGFALVDAANRKIGEGLHKCSDWGEAKDLYFEAGARFAQAGLHREAGTAFNHAAGICKFLGTEYEIANAVSYAADSCRFSDPLQATSLLREQSDMYAKCNLYMQAAKCEKDCGDIQERVGNNEEALQHYVRAVQYYTKDNRSESARRYCEARVRHLLSALGRYAEAAAAFEAYAEVLPTIGLAPTNCLLLAVLAHLAWASEDRYAIGVPRALRKFGEFQNQDTHLRKGKEHEFLTAVFQAFDKASLVTMDAAIAKYRRSSVVETLPTFEALATKCRDNLLQVLLPYM